MTDQFGLFDGATLGLAGEFRIYDFVGPCTEYAGLFGPAQDVGTTGPAFVLQRGLDDDLRTLPHRFPGAGHGLQRDIDTGDRHDLEAALPEVVDEGRLMAAAALPEDLQQGIPMLRPGDFAHRDIHVQCCQMSTVQVSDQVGGTQLHAVRLLSHSQNTPPRAEGSDGPRAISRVPTQRLPPSQTTS